MKNESEKNLSAKERILRTASRLFYRNGYKATGVNEIIEEAGVAKASFYSHFRSKDDLCLAYLQESNDLEMEAMRAWVSKRRNPRQRFLSLIDELGEWMISTDYKGCRFLNMVPEVVDHLSPLRREGRSHYERMRELLLQLSQELLDAEPSLRSRFEAITLANDYLNIFSGAVALSEIYHDIAPIEHAKKMLRRLIDC